MNGPEGFLPKNQNFTTQVARILWYRPYIKLLKIYVLFIYFYEFLNEFLNYRYIAAGVFSKCVPNSKGCCLDPVVYTRVASLHHWIRGKAPGVRDSAGCPKKIEVGIE